MIDVLILLRKVKTMRNISEILNAIRNNTDGNTVININFYGSDFTMDDEPVAEPLPDTDFEVGDRVVVCHTKKNGDTIHPTGEVIETLGKDDKGWYTRVLGDNGKHYRTGLKMDEARFRSKIIYKTL